MDYTKAGQIAADAARLSRVTEAERMAAWRRDWYAEHGVIVPTTNGNDER